MPFIPHNERTDLAFGAHAYTPGQKCYVFYVDFVRQWNAEPRWTTADKIYRDILRLKKSGLVEDLEGAMDLAWQVFFSKYVMPYEDIKEAENGSI